MSMGTDTYPQLPILSYQQPPSSDTIRWMVLASLVLHVMVLVLLAGLRFSKTERPLASYEVSLVTMPDVPRADPAPAPRPPQAQPPKTTPARPMLPADPPPPPVVKEKMTPQPARLPMLPQPHIREPAPAPPAPTPTVKPRPTVAPASPPPVPAKAPSMPPARPSIDREALRGMTLPPDVPTFSDVQVPAGTPKAARSPTEHEVQRLLKALELPGPAVPPAQAPPPAARQMPTRSSVTEELDQQLRKLQEAPPVSSPLPAKVAPTDPVVASKPPLAKPPVTKLQMTGVSGGNPYLSLVQRRISQHWIAPQVDLTSSTLHVIIRFRLDQSGQVSGLAIEQSSGNEYYDMAAKRAVLAASPLPAFPPEMGKTYLDAHFSFTVGEPVS